MGLLENMLKRQVRRIVNNAVDEVVDNTVGAALRDAFGQNGREGTQNFSSRDNYSTQNNPQKSSGEKVLRQRLENAFSEVCPQYEVRTNLDSGVNGAAKYSYGLYDNGVPKAMIMVCASGVHHATKAEKLAMQASNAYGVPYMNFFAHLPNDQDYIVNRLQANIQ